MPQKGQKRPRDDPRVAAERLVCNLDIRITGVQSGDCVRGIGLASRESYIQFQGPVSPMNTFVMSNKRVHDFGIHPQKEYLDQVREFPDLWEGFLRKLQTSVARFHGKELDEIATVLQRTECHVIGSDIDLANSKLMCKGTLSGKDVFDHKFPPEILERVSCELVPLVEIRASVEQQTGRTSLFFLACRWGLVAEMPHEPFTSWDGDAPCLYLQQPTNEDALSVVRLPHTSMKYAAFIVPTTTLDKTNKTPLAFDRMFHKFFSGDVLYKTTHACFTNGTRNFTLGMFKSLLQKHLRHRAEHIAGEQDITVPVDIFHCMVSLFTHPGAFNPTIGRFVRGVESLAKRLAIIAMEDCGKSARSGPRDHARIQSLFATALFARWNPQWTPSADMFAEWVEFALECYESTDSGSQYFDRNTKRHSGEIGDMRKHYETNTIGRDRYNPCLLMNLLGGMSGDFDLVHHCMKPVDAHFIDPFRNHFPKAIATAARRAYALDQHCLPEVVLLIDDSSFLSGIYSPRLASKPFAELFTGMFIKLSGWNQRHGVPFTWTPFRRAVRDAQDLAYDMIRDSYANTKHETVVLRDTYEFAYNIDHAWIAALVGSCQHGKYHISLDPHDITRVLSASMTSGQARGGGGKFLRMFCEKLVKPGIRLGKSPFVALSCATLRANTVDPANGRVGDFYVNGTPLDDILCERAWFTQFQHKNIVEPVPMNILATFNPTSASVHGVHTNFMLYLSRAFRAMTPEEMNRTLYILTGFPSTVKMPQIARDGGAVDEAVTIHDPQAYRFLLTICYFAPAALVRRPKSVKIFSSKYPPLLWWIRDELRRDATTGVPKHALKWTHYDARDPMPGQERVHQQLVHDGRNKNFVWMPTGAGKTFVSSRWTHHIARKHGDFEYLIVTSPRGALPGIMEQYARFATNSTLVSEWKMRAGLARHFYMMPVNRVARGHGLASVWTGDKLPDAPAVLFIEHDHLRLCPSLLNIASRSVVIVDEVHKMMAGTHRASMALQLADMARYVLAMTATPVVNRGTDYLRKWLSFMADFDVTLHSFNVAANAMLSANPDSRNVRDKQTVSIDMNKHPEYASAYKERVPLSLGGTNNSATQADLMIAAQICERVAMLEMCTYVCDQLTRDRKVFVLVRNKQHALDCEVFITTHAARKPSIAVLVDGFTVDLTPERVANGNEIDYEVVIAPLNNVMGYNLSTLDTMVQGVYPSSQATRTQAEGRIDRIVTDIDGNLVSRRLTYITFMCGILEHVYKNHIAASNLETMLRHLARDVLA